MRYFGGITVVFSGDFHQTLPVIPHGSQQDIVLSTIQESYLWSSIHVLRLSLNMRIDRDEHQHKFAQWLLLISKGNHPATSPHYPNINNHLNLPNEIVC